MNKTGAVCPDCGVKTDECPCWNCGHDFCGGHGEVDYLKLDAWYIDNHLAEGLTSEQATYLKTHITELNDAIADTIMEEYYLKVAREEAHALLVYMKA